MKELNKVTGHANPGGMQQFQQIATADTTVNFYGFIAVGDDAVVETLTNVDGTDGLDNFKTTTKTAYMDKYYPGNFRAIKLSSGEALLYLNEQ